ncbi:MAG: hypothetical protein V3U78_01720 [Thiotrichaceae bacterium]
MELWVWGAFVGVGAISGLLGKFIFSRKSPFGLIGNIIFGIVGGVAAGYFVAAGLDSSLVSLVKTLAATSAGALFLVFVMKFIAHP